MRRRSASRRRRWSERRNRRGGLIEQTGNMIIRSHYVACDVQEGELLTGGSQPNIDPSSRFLPFIVHRYGSLGSRKLRK